MRTEPFRPGEILERLVEAKVRFIIVGGLAVGTWGYVRGTKDLDIVPDPDEENLERLAAALVAMGGRVKVREGLLTAEAIRTFLLVGDKTLVVTKLGEVDVLQGLPQVPRFADLAEGATEVELEGVTVLVCSLPALLAMKRAADRPLDRVDIEALQAAHLDESDET